MTVASELIKLKDNLTDSYTAVENKGGTLPQAQNFDNLPDAIDSITTGGTIDSLNITPTTSQQTITATGGTDGYSPITVDAVTSSIDANITAENIKDGVDILGVTGNYQGSGSDKIYLPNNSGSTINAGDKVLCNLGTIGSDTPTNFTHSNSGYFNPILFFDNNSFVTSDDNTGYMHTKADGVWSSTANSIYAGFSGRSCYTFHYNGVISSTILFVSDFQNGYIVTKTGHRPLPSGYQYIGEYNGTHYCILTSGENVYVYNMASNTIGSAVTNRSSTGGQLCYGQIDGNKCIIGEAISGGRRILLYSIDNEGVFTLLSTTVISGYPFYFLGNYVLVTDNADAYRNSSTSPNGHLFCYKIQSDNSLQKVTVPALQTFENTACFVSYDNRNGNLSIGTADHVYFYNYDGRIFRNLNVYISSLPSNPNSFPYRTMMSPDESTIVIEGYGNYVGIYKLTKASHQIVPNSAYNYNLDTSVTGFATGETDSDGKYEVSTVLPEITDWHLSVQYTEPDEVNVYGGAE